MPAAPTSPRAGVAELLLLGGLAVLLLPELGVPPPERAEIYFLDAARGMVEGGDWLVPHYRNEPFFDKPALTYWLMALSMLWLGPSTFAARLVPAAAAVGVLAVTLWLGRLLFDRRTALFGGLCLVSTLPFVAFARVAMSDMLLALWSTLAVALAVRAFRPGAPDWLLPALGAVLGLGFQTKGPIALLIPGFAILVLLWWHRRERWQVNAAGLAGAAVAFALLGLGWFLLVYQRLGLEPLRYFFVRENLQRFAGSTYDVGRPWWFYVPTYLAEGLPWSLFLPLALWRLRGPQRSGERLLAAWAALALVPLSLSKGKIDYYLLPLYPALSLLVGRWFAAVPWGALDRTWTRVTLAAATLGLGYLAIAPLPFPEGWLPAAGAQMLLRAVATAAAVACVSVAVRSPAPVPVAATLAAGSGSLFLLMAAFFLPAFTEGQPNREMAVDVAREQRWRPDARLLLCQDPSRAQRDILFHARVVVEERCDLWPLLASRTPYLMVLPSEQRASFAKVPGYREVGVYRYLPATALTFDGMVRSRLEPGELVLAANYPTADPEAERRRRRDYRHMLQREQSEAARKAPGEDRPNGDP